MPNGAKHVEEVPLPTDPNDRGRRLKVFPYTMLRNSVALRCTSPTPQCS